MVLFKNEIRKITGRCFRKCLDYVESMLFIAAVGLPTIFITILLRSNHSTGSSQLRLKNPAKYEE